MRAMQDDWQRRIRRANDLAGTDQRIAPLLMQYTAILTAQAACFHALVARDERLSGSLERDLDVLRPLAADAFRAIAGVAPAQAMRGTPSDPTAIDALLRAGWCESSIPFLARVVLQPYAEALAGRAGPEGRAHDETTPAAFRVRDDRGLQSLSEAAACPFCGGPPQVSVLRHDTGADGGSRMLICATCATAWPLRRILCVNCGEEDEQRLTYFHAREFDHVRVDTCATCRHYIKTVALNRLGLAVPVVDEVASGALDVWARERGYTKVTPNLIGL